MVKALSVLVLFLLVGCAALGLGAPRTRVIPLGVKDTDDYGRCASSGYEVDLPPHATVAFVASTCVRRFDAGAPFDPSLPRVVPDGGPDDASAEGGR